MKIKKIALGNKNEAFIEKRLSEGVNIIYSNDNNKGKTIIIQSISFALGASDTFPAGIDVSKYYVYLECEINGQNIEIIRKKGNGFFVLYNNKLYIFDTVSEFKYFFSENIAEIPKYIKDGREKMVDFPVYYEMSIIPQDRRNPSNIINKTGTNKEDFLQMIASIVNCSYSNVVDIEEIEQNIYKIKNNIKELSKKIKFAKQNSNIYENLSTTFNREEYDAKKNKLIELERELSRLTRKRTNESTRVIRLENLITELRSINRKVSEGYFICSECGSFQIQYKKGDVVFDTSNSDVRSNILYAIRQQIEIKQAIISEYSISIDKIIKEKGKVIKSIPSEVNNYFIFLDEINNLSNNIEQYDQLNEKYEELKKQKKNLLSEEKRSGEKYKNLINSIVENMNDLQQKIEVNSITNYNSIFTKQTNVFSGSTENEYYFCRSVALANILGHELPIIIDSFRDGETSTAKENNMIGIYKNLNRQVILTSTLKDEEFVNRDKYENLSEINAIDYENIKTYHLLSSEYVMEFRDLIKKFSINL